MSAELELRVRELRAELTQREEEIARLRAGLDDATATVDELRAALADADAKNTRLQEEAAKVEQERRAWDKAAQRSARERDAAVAANTPLVTRVAALEKLLSEERASHDAEELEEYEKRVETWEEDRIERELPHEEPPEPFNGCWCSWCRKVRAVDVTTSHNNPFRQPDCGCACHLAEQFRTDNPCSGCGCRPNRPSEPASAPEPDLLDEAKRLLQKVADTLPSRPAVTAPPCGRPHFPLHDQPGEGGAQLPALHKLRYLDGYRPAQRAGDDALRLAHPHRPRGVVEGEGGRRPALDGARRHPRRRRGGPVRARQGRGPAHRLRHALGDQDYEVLGGRGRVHRAAGQPADRARVAQLARAGKVDAIVRERATGRVLVVEHKTELRGHPAGLRVLAAPAHGRPGHRLLRGRALLGHDVAGCLYDVIAKPRSRPGTFRCSSRTA
jgi:hypothetical protein